MTGELIDFLRQDPGDVQVLAALNCRADLDSIWLNVEGGRASQSSAIQRCAGFLEGFLLEIRLIGEGVDVLGKAGSPGGVAS